MNILEVKNIQKFYGNNHVLKGIDLQMKEGEVVAIIGSSGGGKSTLLRCLTFLEKIQKGDISIGGEKIVDNGVYPKDKILRQKALQMGLVFQDFNLFPHKTVLENLILAPMLVKKMSKEQATKLAMDNLAKVGLQEKANAYPSDISGGQKQRVAIARALCMSPTILCFDEPTSALDPELTGEVLKVIGELRKSNVTMLIVTHEIMFAREIADEVIFLDNGIVLESGNAKEVIDNPQKERTKLFMNSILKGGVETQSSQKEATNLQVDKNI